MALLFYFMYKSLGYVYVDTSEMNITLKIRMNIYSLWRGVLFFISDSMLSTEGSDLTALLSLHWNYVMGTYALCQDAPAYECLIETCFLCLGVAIIIFFKLFSPLSIKIFWIPVNCNHFTIHNCFHSDLYISYKWDLCNRDTFYHTWMLCYVLVTWGDSKWLVFREEFAIKVYYRKKKSGYKSLHALSKRAQTCFWSAQ